MSTECALRAAGPSDAGAVAALHADSWRRHYRGAYADSYLDGDLEAERLTTWTDRLRRPESRSCTVLAEEGGRLVGFVHVIFDTDAVWGSLIENLHVRHDRQRQGHGRLLMAAAGQEVVARAATRVVHLWVLAQNQRGQAFYRSLGGDCVEVAVCPPPGGVAERLQGSPQRHRFVWRDAAWLARPTE